MQYIPNTDADRCRMLEAVGASSVEELFEQIPSELHSPHQLDLPGPMSEIDLRRLAAGLSAENADADNYPSFLGAGIYDHYIPSTVPAITGRSEFYTSYTPYQPEISQGTLQSIYEFQTLICELTGMDVTNASMYDGATALAEAALMASSINGRTEWIISDCVHPSYRETVRTYAWASGHSLVEGGRKGISTDLSQLSDLVSENTACVIVQSPNFFGSIEDLEKAASAVHDKDTLLIVLFDPISLGLLKTPGDFGADIAVGEGQPMGISMNFGGPLLGLFTCKQEYVRHMPGRLVGATTDTQGRRGYVLTLQTREQHIRREKATSNICTNQGLCALAATVYLSTLGKTGLRRVAELCARRSHYAADSISAVTGYEIPFRDKYFKEFVVKCPRPVVEINNDLIERGIIGGLDLGRFYSDLRDHMLVCVTEMRSREDIDKLVEGLAR